LVPEWEWKTELTTEDTGNTGECKPILTTEDTGDTERLLPALTPERALVVFSISFSKHDSIL
jgi:hypothetical protein